MRRLRPIAAYAAIQALLLTSACDGPQSEQPFDTDQYMNAWLELWNTYNLSLVDDLFLTDSSVTYLSSEREGLIKGIDEVRSHHEGFGFVVGGREAEQDLWVEDLHTTSFWPTAIVTGIWLFGDREGAPEAAQRGPFTFVYVQRGDNYRLAHLNFGTYLDATEDDRG
jgi:hypothetical protein